MEQKMYSYSWLLTNIEIKSLFVRHRHRHQLFVTTQGSFCKCESALNAQGTVFVTFAGG